MTRQQYTPEFRHRAVVLLPESGRSVARMAQEPDIKENTLCNWKKCYQDKAEDAFSNTPPLSEQKLEIRRLKAGIAEPEEDKLILKKAAAFFARESCLDTPWSCSYRLSMKRICLLLSVSRRGCQSWRNRTPGQRRLADNILSQRLIQLHHDSRGTYGIRRQQRDLQDERRFHGKSRISRLMKQSGLKAADQRRYKVTTNNRHDHPVAPGLLNRGVSPAKLDVAWASDITYIRTGEGGPVWRQSQTRIPDE